jgi:glyoxylase-like metal-dependent hydrolase (beta-lactamase superfamily II)
MRSRVVAALLIASPIALAAQGNGHRAPTVLESYTKARTLIEAAVAAHGGVESLREARNARVRTEGWEYHPTQGSRPVPPFDSTRRLVHAMIELDQNRLVWEGTRGWPGGFHYTNRFLAKGDSTYNITPRNDQYQVVTVPAPVHQQYGNLFTLPQFYLLAAHESNSPGVRRYLGRMRIPSGAEVEVVHYTLAPQGNIALGLDPQTHRLRAILSVAPDVFTGDTEVVTEFLGWRMLGGMLLPSEVLLHRGGNVTRRERYVAAETKFRIPDSLLAPPASTRLAPPSPRLEDPQQLAEGVWLVGGGSRSLVVAFGDHLVVVDAPSSGSADVITRAATLAPGKPIRYVVPTHHHDDHFAGVRYHARNGATIVTTPGNTDYLRRIMTAPASSLMLAANQVPPSSSYRAETITDGVRVFTDGARRLELHQIASPHAQEMLVAWLPAEGILFQADLIEAPRDGTALRGANAETTTHLARIIREKGWQVKTFAGAHATLKSAAEFEALVRLPIIPPGQ